MLPLEGVRVLDLSRLLPGPYCSLLLADLGAEVVKVEKPGEGDYLRWIAPLKNNKRGAFSALNRNKKSIGLDLTDEEGKEFFLSLVAGGYNIVIESFMPGVMKKLGLGYDILKSVCSEFLQMAAKSGLRFMGRGVVGGGGK